MIGERTAENIKMEIGSAYPVKEEVPAAATEAATEEEKEEEDASRQNVKISPNGERTMEIRGRDLITGLPKVIEIGEEEIREALSEPVAAIVDAIKTNLEKTPPELAADIMDKGIMLTGGGALLRGLDKLIHKETHMPIHIAESPLDCVAVGAGKALDNIDKMGRK